MIVRAIALLKGAMAVPQIRSSPHGNVELRGLRVGDWQQVSQLYALLNEGKELGVLKRLFYFAFGSRVAIVAAEEEAILGFGLYSFGIRDLTEKTVHESFTGVANILQGQGLGTAIRKHAISHFECTGLAGISSRVSLSNAPSLQSNEKLGFHIVETYFDPEMAEERAYMIRKLSGGNFV